MVINYLDDETFDVKVLIFKSSSRILTVVVGSFTNTKQAGNPINPKALLGYLLSGKYDYLPLGD
jgi:hypothetical protein